MTAAKAKSNVVVLAGSVSTTFNAIQPKTAATDHTLDRIELFLLLRKKRKA
jgi:hypothetical protein